MVVGDLSAIFPFPSRLQAILLSREFFGWPFYGVLLGLDRFALPSDVPSGNGMTVNRFADIECGQLPVH